MKKELYNEWPRTLSMISKHSAQYRNPKGPAKYFAAYKHKKLLDEINWNEIDLDTKIIKDGLNEKIWDGFSLKKDTRAAMLKIAKEFYEFLKISPVKLKDIRLTGSLANFNWTDKSDIDIHLVLDYRKIDDDFDFVSEFLSTKKSLWEKIHDLKIKGIDVELYAEDINEPHHSTGVYSLVKDEWLTKPTKDRSIEIDPVEVKKKAASIMNQIDYLESIKSNEERIKSADKIRDKVKKIRVDGLNSPEEEFSIGNMVFKVLRNTGYLGKLRDIKIDSMDKELSLSEGEKKTGGKHNFLMVENGLEKMMGADKIEIIKDFISFTRDKLKINETVKVGLRKGRDRFIRTTASYLPNENVNFVKCEGRALVDILRSIGHELVHNKQREAGVFNPNDKVQNIGGHIEDQANSIAGILIKDFANNYGYERIYDI